jgi:uncharacterized protein YndB with AHSA1/START domain
MTTPHANTVDIDDGAPVVSREELFIDAPAEAVWNLHTDVNAWPAWRSDVDSAQLTDPFGIGSSFRWQTAGLDITSTITQVVPGTRTTWGGPADGIDGVHVWEFLPRYGGVLVRRNGGRPRPGAAPRRPPSAAERRTSPQRAALLLHAGGRPPRAEPPSAGEHDGPGRAPKSPPHGV